MKEKVSITNQLYHKEVSSTEAREVLEKSTSSKQDLELDAFLKELVNNYDAVEEVLKRKEYQNLFLVTDFDSRENISSKIDLLKESKEELENGANVLKKLIEKQADNKSFKQIKTSFLTNYYEGILEEVNLINQYEVVLNYLFEKSEFWKIVENRIEFQTRVSFDEYDSLVKTGKAKKLGYCLIEDIEGPVIEAGDVTIYLHQSISIPDRVHCVDSVDGEVACQVDGDYDNTKVGNYPIVVSSVDQSNNRSEKTITVRVIQNVNMKPYLIHVIRNQNVVVVYGLDENYEYTKVVQVFVCSTGKDNATPTGTFTTTKGANWGALYGGVWGQYTTRIVGSILFHSVPYYSQSKGDLEWEEYNKLGTQASLGCVRLAVRDAKWIFYNCPVGTTVKIYDGDLPSSVSKPSSISIDGNSPNRGWDPTDDDEANPWR